MDAMSEVVKRAAAFGQGLAQGLGLSVSDLVGLHKLGEPMTMKEMGRDVELSQMTAVQRQ
jgi:hypothetical protein